MAKKFGNDLLRSPDLISENSSANNSPLSGRKSSGSIRLSPSIQYGSLRSNRQHLYNVNTNETTFETVLSDEDETDLKEDHERFTPLSQCLHANTHTNRLLEDMEMLPSSALNIDKQSQKGNNSNIMDLDNKFNNVSLDPIPYSKNAFTTSNAVKSTCSSSSSSDTSAKFPNNNAAHIKSVTQQPIYTSSIGNGDAPPNYFTSDDEEDEDGNVFHTEHVDNEKSSTSSIDEETKLQLQCLPYKTIYDAYYAIELDSNIKEIDWVETSYNLKIQDDPDNKVLYDRALLTLGLGLKSLPLLNLVLTNNDVMLQYYAGVGFNYEDAIRCLKLDKDNFTEMDVINNFVVTCLKNEKEFNESNILDDEVFDNFLYYFISLKCIGEKMNSDIINRFLSTGFVDDRLLKNGNWPVGLFNMGNTCYLNSLLQYYFVITPLKNYILNYKKKEEENKEEEKEKEVKEIEEEGDETEEEDNHEVKNKDNNSKSLDLIRCQDFLAQIKKLYQDMISTQYKISVASNELVYLAFAPRGGPGLTDGKVPDMDSLEMTLDIGRQQDVTECMLNFMDQINDTIIEKDDKAQNEIKETLFNGKLAITFKDLLDSDIQGKSDMEENFSSLLIHLHNRPKNLYEALDQFFNDDQQVMNMKEYGQVKKKITIKDMPEILQIQIQRVEFDKNKLEPVKNNFQLPFPEKFYLDRYVKDAVDESFLKDYQTLNQRLLFLKQKKHNLMKKAKSSFNGTQPVTLRSSISTTLKYLQSELYENSMQFEDEELIRAIKCLSGMKDHIDKKIQSVDDEIEEIINKKNVHFDKFNKYEYSLFAIFMHRGEASYGHYWIYIKDGSMWRKYNDEEVIEVENPKETIFNFDQENDDTAYCLAYVRSDKIDELIKPLDRDIIEE